MAGDYTGNEYKCKSFSLPIMSGVPGNGGVAGKRHHRGPRWRTALHPDPAGAAIQKGLSSTRRTAPASASTGSSLYQR